MKTIKQIADEIGVTKQAVFYRIKRPPLSNTLQSFMSKVDGVLMVSFDGETLIKQAFDIETAKENEVFGIKKPSKETPLFDGEIIEVLKKNIEVLQSQLEIKDSQLEIKDRQIVDLTSALVSAQQSATAAQALHAGTMSHLAIPDKKKPGILSKLFKVRSTTDM